MPLVTSVKKFSLVISISLLHNNIYSSKKFTVKSENEWMSYNYFKAWLEWLLTVNGRLFHPWISNFFLASSQWHKESFFTIFFKELTSFSLPIDRRQSSQAADIQDIFFCVYLCKLLMSFTVMYPLKRQDSVLGRKFEGGLKR